MKDWSGLISFEPGRVLRPTSLAELERDLDDLARDTSPTTELRTLGSLHSCAPVCASTRVLDVGGLPHDFELAADGRSAVLSTNTTLHAALDRLAEHGKSLAATGGTYHQTLAGLISTSTAPATPKVSLYSGLRWVEYLTIDEAARRVVRRKVSRGDPDFPGMVSSLGAIGVLTRIEIDVVEEPYFEALQKIVPMDEILGDLDATSARYDFWRVNWLPRSERALLWAARRIPKEQAKADGDYPEDASENILSCLFRYMDEITLGATGPLLSPVIEAVYNLIATFYNLGDNRFTGPLRNMLPVDKRAPLHVAMAEWSFAPSDLPRVLAACRSYFGAAGWPNIPTEIELSPTDSWWMSPWNWEGLPYVVKLNFMYLVDVCKTDAEKALISTHLRGLWDALVAAGLRFKAHWGKINFHTPEYVARNYGFERFRPLVRRRFLNDYLRQRFPA